MISLAPTLRQHIRLPQSRSALRRMTLRCWVACSVQLRLLHRFGDLEWIRADLSRAQRGFLATEIFENEWENGGIAQYVVNEGDDVEQALAFAEEGYTDMGLPA